MNNFLKTFGIERKTKEGEKNHPSTTFEESILINTSYITIIQPFKDELNKGSKIIVSHALSVYDTRTPEEILIFLNK